MVRYGVFVFMNLVMMVYVLWYMFTESSYFSRLVILMDKLFQGEVDPTLLDSSVSYNCSIPWHFTLGTSPEDEDKLAFYS